MLKFSPRILFLIVSIVLLTSQSSVSGANLECEYLSSDSIMGIQETLYYCKVSNNGIYTGERVTIDSAEGEHDEEYTDDDVKGIYFTSVSYLNFFPKNLENIFHDMIMIVMDTSYLQEIRQDDLRVFPKLQRLDLDGNKITTINKDLFKFNPELKVIDLQRNQISYIDPNVFDHLNHLRYLRLNDNKCKNDLSNAENSRSEVLELIQRVRNGECSIKYNAELNETIENLQNTVNELKASNEKLTTSLSEVQQHNENFQRKSAENELKINEMQNKCENKILQVKLANSESLNEKLRESNDKINELNDKYINLFHAKHTESQNLNEKLRESNEKLRDLNEKYINLLNAKLIESEKINTVDAGQLNDDGQKKSIFSGTLTIYFQNDQPPTCHVG